MEKFKRKLRNRMIYLTVLVIFTLTTFGLLMQYDLEDYTCGFFVGLVGSLCLCFIISLINYFKLMKNPDKLREEYIKEDDERNQKIKEKVDSTSFITFLLLLAGITTIMVFIDHKIATLISCLIWLGVVVKLLLTVYYKKKL